MAMASGDRKPNQSNELAILKSVLDAEKAAAGRINAARQEGEALIQAARAEARQIEARADARIQRLHASTLSQTEARKGRMAKAFAQERSAWEAGDRHTQIKAATQVLAKRLIGWSRG